MDKQELANIVARASFIGERTASYDEPNLSDDKTINARFEAWAQAVSEKGEREILDRLWNWDGITPEIARRMVAPVTLAADASLPNWAHLIDDVLSLPLPTDSPAFFQTDPPIAFQEILQPFVLALQRNLQTCVGWDRLAPDAQNQIARNFLSMLAGHAVEPLFLEFQAFRNRQPFGALATVVAKSGKPSSTALYQKFVAQQRAGGFRALLIKYPVLARILGSITLTRIHVLREFLQQLDADWEALAKFFNGDQALITVQSISLGLSDAHRGGHGVIGIQFEMGLHLIYKPKDLAIEAAYNDLLTWLNARGIPLALRALAVLNRGEYGWVTFAEHAACADNAAVARYYYRVGMLLALMYALEGTDCHLENLIAAGEQPILIDHETLFHHRVPEETTAEMKSSAMFAAFEKMDGSVLRVGLLPGWRIGKDKKIAYDASGLGATGDQIVPFRHLRMAYHNTDGMQITLEQGRMGGHANVPMLNDAPARLEENVEPISDGFKAMYDFLLAQRAALLAPDSPLNAFRHANVRFVFRATQVYASLLKQAQQPLYLRDGAEYSLYLERIARAHVQVEQQPACYPLLNCERAGLLQNDIPFFAARTDSADLQLDQAKVSFVLSYFTGPSFELATARIQSLSPQDCAWQMYLIETALRARVAESGEPDRAATQVANATASSATRRLSSDEYIAQAIGIAEKIRAAAILGEDGTAAWFGPQYLPDSGRYQLSILSFNLYDGLVGVGLFLAALARATNDSQWRDLALAAFKSTRDGLAKESASMVEFGGIGGTAGVPSALYAMLKAGQTLGDATLIDEARAAAAKLSREQINADKSFDIISGAAGGILCLLALSDATGDANALALAIDCGEHLLATRIETHTGHRAWLGIAHHALAGFSHGAAGYAYALMRLAQATGRADFRAAAEEAIAYEDALFDPSKNNWPDLRDNYTTRSPADLTQPKFMVAWCHGASGIGMSRIDLLNGIDTPNIRRDIDAALAATAIDLARLPVAADHLCCGNLGRIELFLTAGQSLQRPDLIAQAHVFAAQVVAQAQTHNGYRYANFLTRGTFSPGLYQGGAGIGYELLRLAQPDQFPNLLLWK